LLEIFLLQFDTSFYGMHSFFKPQGMSKGHQTRNVTTKTENVASKATKGMGKKLEYKIVI
jgi:hypothetical protein